MASKPPRHICRRAADKLFYHLTCNPMDTEKLRASLDAANDEKNLAKAEAGATREGQIELGGFQS